MENIKEKKTIDDLFNYVKKEFNEDKAYQVIVGLCCSYRDDHDLGSLPLELEAMRIVFEEFTNSFDKNLRYAYSEDAKKLVLDKCSPKNITLADYKGDDHLVGLIRLHDEAEYWIREYELMSSDYIVLVFNPRSLTYEDCSP